MNEELKKLYEEQNKLRTAQTEFLDKIDKEKREMTAEEKTEYEKVDAELDKNIQSIQDKEDVIRKRDKLEGLENRSQQITNLPIIDGGGNQSRVDFDKEKTEKEMVGYRSFLAGRNESTEEFRALQADADIAGGYTVVPPEFVNILIKAVDNYTFMPGLSTTFTLAKAESLGAVSLDADPEDADWTGEITSADEDTAMKFAKRELTPHPLSKLIKVSRKLLRSSVLNIESIVADRLGYKIAVPKENAYMTGHGTNQPLGIFTASALGISTGRDFSTGNTTTEIRGNGLIEAFYALKSQYMQRATWIFHRDAVKQIRKLKTGDGVYIWTAGIAGDRPSTILGRPYVMSEYAPNTFTTGLYVGIVGDIKFYWIVDSLFLEIQRLIEKYALTNQIGFIARAESDGMPILEEAFSRVTLA